MILTSINDIDAARWDSLVGPDAVTRTHAYLAAIESAGIEDCRHFYPVIFNARNEMVAHACVYTIVTDFAQLLPGPLRPFVRALRALWPGFLRARLTECASPLVVGHSISVRDEAQRAQIVRRVADAATDIAYSQRSPVVLVRDFLGADAGDVGALLEHGFNRVSNMPLARIRIRWSTYREYLAAMRPRYRKDIERRLRRARESGDAVETVRGYGQRAECWSRQARVVYAAARRFKRETVTADYYRRIESALGPDSHLLAVMRDGRPVAHGLVLTDAANTIATFFGREAGAPGREWFMLVDEVIRLAIARRSRYVHLGLGSYRAKGLIGADFEPVTICCKSPYAPLNWLMRRWPHMAIRQLPPPPRIFRA